MASGARHETRSESTATPKTAGRAPVGTGPAPGRGGTPMRPEIQINLLIISQAHSETAREECFTHIQIISVLRKAALSTQ